MDPLINPPFLYKQPFGVSITEVQKGQGLFSVFSKVIPLLKSLFSRAAPLAKSVAKNVANNSFVKEAAKELQGQAIDAGIEVGRDLLAGESVKDSLKRHAANAGRNVAEKMLDISKKRRTADKRKKSKVNLDNDDDDDEPVLSKKKKRSKNNRKPTVTAKRKRKDLFS